MKTSYKGVLSKNVLSKKMSIFFDEEHFCLHWNHSGIEKCGNVGGSWKFQENRATIIHVNTFIKIGSINSFKSWLLVIKLVDRCVPFLPTLPEKLLPQPPNHLLCQYISCFCRFFKKIIISSMSLEEVVIIIKFLIKILYTKKQPHCDSF